MIHFQTFQIVYDDDTAARHDPGFELLDNFGNERPDWYEYWPIRKYLLSNDLDEQSYYAFFSPRFGQKTGLNAEDVRRTLARHTEDVVLFSPFLDLAALYFNQLDQGESVHPGLAALVAGIVPIGLPGSLLLQDATNTVFCNFFAAKPAFWKAWLARCETVFALAERGEGTLAGQLLAPSDYEDGKTAHYKVFLIERMASLLLATDRRWRAAAPFALKLPLAIPRLENDRDRLIRLDKLKFDAVRAKDPVPLLRQYVVEREQMVGELTGAARAASQG